MKRLIFLSLLIGTLSACGFRPLYGGVGFNGVVEGQNITVDEIPGRSGYLLRRHLIEDLSTGLPGLNTPAQLTVTLNEQLTRAALLPDGSVARSFLNASGKFVLASEEGTVSGTVSVRIPYAATSTPYTDVSAQIDASQRAMLELSRQITDNLRIQVQSLK